MTEHPTPLHTLYGRWLEDLWNGDPSVAAEIVSPDFVGHWPDHEVHGPDGLASAVRETHAMFDGVSFTLAVGPLVDGDMVAGRWIGSGKSRQGTARFIGNDILRARDGLFTEYWVATVVLP
jgi:hypothetical protein